MTTWLNTEAAAAHIGRNPHEVRRMAAAGTIPAYKSTPAGEWRYDLAELDAWVRGTTTPPAARRITTRTSRRAS